MADPEAISTQRWHYLADGSSRELKNIIYSIAEKMQSANQLGFHWITLECEQLPDRSEHSDPHIRYTLSVRAGSPDPEVPVDQ